MSEQEGRRVASSDVHLLRTAWWSLKRGADALDACSDRYAGTARAAVAEIRQTMGTIHDRLEASVGAGGQHTPRGQSDTSPEYECREKLRAFEDVQSEHRERIEKALCRPSHRIGGATEATGDD